MALSLVAVWNQLKAQADTYDADVLERIARAYASGYTTIDPQILALTQQLELLQEAGKLTVANVQKSAAFRNLIMAIGNELDDYSVYLRTEIKAEALASAKQGLSAGEALMLAATAHALGVAVKDLPKDAVTIPSEDAALKFLAQYLDPKGPLFTRINELSSYRAGEIAEGILERVAEGKNPKIIARWITDSYGMGLTDSMRQMRTVQLYSYRQANREVAMSNGDVLEGMVWCAELDDRVCMACVELHGQVFPVDAICDDHHNGRCALIPWVKGEPNPIEQSGEDWFNEQPEETQKNMLGAQYYDAWKGGAFDLKDITKEHEDEIFGLMQGIAPLWELLGAEPPL